MNRVLHRHIIGAAVMVLFFVGCGGPGEGPEEALRAWVARGEEAAENKDRGELLDMISPAYADARGNSREDIGNLLRIYFLRQNRVALVTRIDELTVLGDTAAEIAMQVGMAATDSGLLGFDADAYRIEMELEHDGDEWRLIAARWAEIGDDVR